MALESVSVLVHFPNCLLSRFDFFARPISKNMIHAKLSFVTFTLLAYRGVFQNFKLIGSCIFAMLETAPASRFYALLIAVVMTHELDWFFTTELNRFISTLTLQQKQEPFVQQALDMHRALSTNNYHAFFRLFAEAANMGGYILDHLLERERVNALVIITKG